MTGLPITSLRLFFLLILAREIEVDKREGERWDSCRLHRTRHGDVGRREKKRGRRRGDEEERKRKAHQSIVLRSIPS